MLSLLALLSAVLSTQGLTLTDKPLTTTYESAPPGFTETIGRMPLAIGCGLLTGLLLLAIWKKRRDRPSAGLLLLLAFALPNRQASACANIEARTLESSYTKYLETINWFTEPVERAFRRPAHHSKSGRLSDRTSRWNPGE